MVEGLVISKFEELRSEHEESLRRLENLKEALQSRLDSVQSSAEHIKPVVHIPSGEHTVVAEHTEYNLDEPVARQEYIRLRLEALPTLIKQISQLRRDICQDGLPAVALSRVPNATAEDKLCEFLCSVTQEGKRMPLICATPETTGILRDDQSNLSLLPRQYCLSPDKLDRESSGNKHVIARVLLKSHEKSQTEIDQCVSELGRESWRSAIVKPSKTAIKSGRACFTMLVGVFREARSREDLKELLTTRCLIEAVAHTPSTLGIPCGNKDEQSWAKRDLSFGNDSSERFVLRLLDLIAAALIEPALHVDDIVKPEAKLSYDDHMIVLDQARNALRDYAAYMKVFENLSKVAINIVRSLAETKLPPRGTMVSIFKDFIIHVITEKIPWGVESVRRLREVYDLQVGPNPEHYLRAQFSTYCESLTRDTRKDAKARQEALDDFEKNMSGSGLVGDFSVSVSETSSREQPVSPKTKTTTPTKAPAVKLRSLTSAQSALKSKWFRRYCLKWVKPNVPAALNLACKCAKKTCINCCVVGLIADLNAVAYLANSVGVKKNKLVRHNTTTKKSSCKGGLALSVPVALNAVINGQWN